MDSTKRVWRRKFNEEFFFEWSDDLAWLVGLIWSDGCLSYNSVKFGCKDRDLMETVAEMIAMEGGVRVTSQGAFALTFSSQRVADLLRSFGLTERKSLTIGWPAGLPTEYETAFVRGLLDGDGCFSLKRGPRRTARQLSILLTSGSPALALAYENWLDRIGLAHTTQERKGQRDGWHTQYVVRVSRQGDAKRLGCLLYALTDAPCLLRKRAVFEEWVAERGTAEEWDATCRAHTGAATKRMWEDPEYRAKQEAARPLLFSKEANAKRSVAGMALWEDPEYRERLMASRRTIWQRPGYREMMQAARAGTKPGPSPLERWAKDFDACVDCGRSDRSHRAWGLCRTCYQYRVRHVTRYSDGLLDKPTHR